MSNLNILLLWSIVIWGLNIDSSTVSTTFFIFDNGQKKKNIPYKFSFILTIYQIRVHCTKNILLLWNI